MDDQVLIAARWIIAGSGELPVLSEQAILVRGGRIAEIGPSGDLRDRYPDAQLIGGADCAVLPGLINAHHHSHAASTLQQGIPDDILESWLLSLAGLRPVPARLATLMSAYRLMRSGVTTVLDVISGGATQEGFVADVGDTLAAYDLAGLRARVAAGVSFESLLVAGDDQAFIDSLAPEARALARARLAARRGISPTAYLDAMDDLVRAWPAGGRVAAWYGPPGPQWVGDKALLAITEAAARHDAGIQTHAVESFYEGLHGLRAYGVPTILHLERLGVLSERFSIAHGVWLTAAEIEALARCGAAVCHNPSSNLRLRAGIAPLNALRARGVTVALGMDGTTQGDDEDMFAEMRLAMRLHRPPRYGAEAPAPADILSLATAGGARLLRQEGELGRIAVGAAADLALIDLGHLTWPWVAAETDPRELVLLRARADDVRTVLVGGEIVLRDGCPTRFDIDAVAAEIADVLDAQPARPRAAADAERLRPYVEAHYAAWEAPELRPWTIYNSRD